MDDTTGFTTDSLTLIKKTLQAELIHSEKEMAEQLLLIEAFTQEADNCDARCIVIREYMEFLDDQIYTKEGF